MAMNLHKGDNVNRLHSKVINTIPYITFRTLWCIGKPQKIMLIIIQITEVIVEYIPGLGFIEIRRTVRVIKRK